MNYKKLAEVGSKVARAINIGGSNFDFRKFLQQTLEQMIKNAGLEIAAGSVGMTHAFFPVLFDSLDSGKIRLPVSDILTILKALPSESRKNTIIKNYIKKEFANNKDLAEASFIEKIERLTN